MWRWIEFMTSVYWRRDGNSAVTSLACRKLGGPAARRSVRQGIAFSVQVRKNSYQARAVRSRSSCQGIIVQ